ncbi:MAG: hypothetical protein ACRCX2_01045 [Paraclostridium sp.]
MFGSKALWSGLASQIVAKNATNCETRQEISYFQDTLEYYNIIKVAIVI